MKTVKKTFALGTIEYRRPNIIESMQLMGKLGVRPDGTFSKDEFTLIGDIMSCMGTYIVKIDAKKPGEGSITDFDESLEHPEFLEPYAQIALDLIHSINPEAQKKIQAPRKKKAAKKKATKKRAAKKRS
jgi:hypothetical protein